MVTGLRHWFIVERHGPRAHLRPRTVSGPFPGPPEKQTHNERPPTSKPAGEGPFFVAGAGFEPTTSGVRASTKLHARTSPDGRPMDELHCDSGRTVSLGGPTCLDAAAHSEPFPGPFRARCEYWTPRPTPNTCVIPVTFSPHRVDIPVNPCYTISKNKGKGRKDQMTYTTSTRRDRCFTCDATREFTATLKGRQLVELMCNTCGTVDSFPIDDEDDA